MLQTVQGVLWQLATMACINHHLAIMAWAMAIPMTAREKANSNSCSSFRHSGLLALPAQLILVPAFFRYKVDDVTNKTIRIISNI
jgi:hypothetical protein